MTTRPILIVVSSHAELRGEPNGTYLPELTHVLSVLLDAGLPWLLASPKGGVVPVYGPSDDDVSQRVLKNSAVGEALSASAPLPELTPDDYSAVFYPGGYGLLFDLEHDTFSKQILRRMHELGRPIAAVCHGPAAFHQVELSNGKFLVEGMQVTGFTREEEIAMSTLSKVPFLVEEVLIASGATYRKRKAWDELVVQDYPLITGQNPGSATGVGRALARAVVGAEAG